MLPGQSGQARRQRRETLEGLSIWHLLVVAAVALVLFGRGKVSSLMGEVGKGITAFKRGISEGDREIVGLEETGAVRDVTPAEAEKAKA